MSINTLPEGYILNNDYKILKSLGQGGFGITYLAEDSNLGHQVVIKEFLPQNMAAREQSHYTVSPYTKGDELFGHLLKRFIEEARLLAGLRHPNVVKVTRLLDANNTAYFVMDYEEGETLEEYLEHTSKLKEEDILSIMMPILEGTKYVHAKGILHRDIAPDNIYLKQNGMPILIDFGAARNAIAQESQTLSAIAKDGYSPPEQYTPNADQNPATDIYALGAVFYRMITGHKPANAAQRQMALLKGEPDPIGELTVNYKNKYSKNLLQAIGKALDIHQERRFQDIASFQKAIAEGVIQFVKSKPKVKRTTESNKGKNNSLVVGLIVALLGVSGVAGYLMMNTKEDNKSNYQKEITTTVETEESKRLAEEKAKKIEDDLAKKEAEVAAEKERLWQEKKRKREENRQEQERVEKEEKERKEKADRLEKIEKLKKELEQERLKKQRKEAQENKEQIINFNENGINIRLKYPGSVRVGKKFILRVEMTNNNQGAKQGGLTLSFPDMISMSGQALGNSFSLLKGYSSPDKIYNKHARKGIPAEYFMVEGWQSTSWPYGRTKSFSVELVAPRGLDKLDVNLRGILWVNSKNDTRKIPYSSTKYDQQGYAVKQFSIKIKR